MYKIYIAIVTVLFLTLAGCQTQPTVSPTISFEVNEIHKKAESGDIEAQFMLGNIYESGGQDARQSSTNAMKWYKRAADKGHVEAQMSIARIYLAEQQYPEALAWYEKAARQGNALAINNLAYIYEEGLGVEQNQAKAHELYLESANLGLTKAMLKMADMYRAGQLGEVDNIKAYVWCARSLRYVEQEWPEVRSRSKQCIVNLQNELSSEEIVQAEQEAGTWLPGHRIGQVP